jgi:hypothetical protein
MRWFRFGGQRVQHDPGQQQALARQVRDGFGGHVAMPFAEQARAVTGLLEGDDGLVVAAGILREFADAAHADLSAQVADLLRRGARGFAVDRRNYRPLWRDAGSWLRWSLFELPGGPHPYVHLAGAVTALGAQPRRAVKVLDPEPVLATVFEALDLVIAGWEFGRVRIDTDGAGLAAQLIGTARDLRAALPDEPPPLPPPVRELMRRNNSVTVLDPATEQPVATFNPGKEMRESLLA